MATSAYPDTKETGNFPFPIGTMTGCTGMCIYKWVGNQYTYSSGACSGGPGCENCPPELNNDARAIILKHPILFPNPDIATVLCSMLSGDSLNVIAIILYELLLESEKTKKRYKAAGIGFGVLSMLLIAALIYVIYLS